MQRVNNKTEYEKLWPYPDSKPNKYPRKYPVLAEVRESDGGLMGDYYYIATINIPTDVNVNSFIRGVNAALKS